MCTNLIEYCHSHFHKLFMKANSIITYKANIDLVQSLLVPTTVQVYLIL